MMTTKQVADRLIELCRKGQIQQAGEELYADDIASLDGVLYPRRIEDMTKFGFTDVLFPALMLA